MGENLSWVNGGHATPNTLWSKVRDLYTTGQYDWSIGLPVMLRHNRTCLCAGGAIAQVLTGHPDDMYRPFPNVEAALAEFANHVGADFLGALTNAERVYKWNDRLPHNGGKDILLAALTDLHNLAVTECQHRLQYVTVSGEKTGVCLFCEREVI